MNSVASVRDTHFHWTRIDGNTSGPRLHLSLHPLPVTGRTVCKETPRRGEGTSCWNYIRITRTVAFSF